MNLIVFNQVVDRFNNGQVNFNLGINWSFLFNQKWYPARAFMVDYNSLMGLNSEINLYSSIFELSKFIPVVSADIEYLDHFPVNVN